MNTYSAFENGCRTRLILDYGKIEKRFPDYISFSDTELYFPYDRLDCSDIESYYTFAMLDGQTYEKAAEDYFDKIIKLYNILNKPKPKIDKEAAEYKKYLKLKEKYDE